MSYQDFIIRPNLSTYNIWTQSQGEYRGQHCELYVNGCFNKAMLIVDLDTEVYTDSIGRKSGNREYHQAMIFDDASMLGQCFRPAQALAPPSARQTPLCRP